MPLRKYLFLFFLFVFYSFSDDIIVFESPGAPCCKKLKENFFQYISLKYGINFKYYNIGLPENYNLYVENLRKLNLPISIPGKLPVIFYKNSILVGEEEIKANLIPLIERKHNFISKKIFSFYLPAIILAGFLDGINPCAFAVIIFFITYLSCIGKKKESLKIASFYIPGVFFTYFLIGILFINIFSIATKIYFLKFIFFLIFFLICVILAFLNFLDFIKSKKKEEIILKLPDKIRKKINSILIKFSLPGIFYPSSFTLGVFVSILETGCTGQIYLPIIIFLSTLKIKRAIFLLLIYNLFFIIPLFLIFIFAYLGINIKIFSNFFQKNIPTSKLLISIFFLFLSSIFLFLLLKSF